MTQKDKEALLAALQSGKIDKKPKKAKKSKKEKKAKKEKRFFYLDCGAVELKSQFKNFFTLCSYESKCL